MEGQAQPPSDMARTKTVINVRRENAPDRARKTVLKAYGYVTLPLQYFNWAKSDFGQGVSKRAAIFNMYKRQLACDADVMYLLCREARATKRRTHVEVKIKPRRTQAQSQSTISRQWNQFANYMENYRLHIFWITLYSLLCIAIFAERAYCKCNMYLL